MKLLFRWINKLLCGWNVGLYFRPRIRYEGKKCLPAFTRGPAIIITNHKNQMDFLLVLYLNPMTAPSSKATRVWCSRNERSQASRSTWPVVHASSCSFV